MDKMAKSEEARMQVRSTRPSQNSQTCVHTSKLQVLDWKFWELRQA